jgi:tetratricopeptide (TPR) repeat protein/tRNA A-37 threonylcarbamoyl transferase component Bud32/TolB-like protein
MSPEAADPLVGALLAHYQILEKLGEGGMGVVYRARDTRLHREVALKLLPAALMDDHAARERLLREARTASQLNHPHICIIHEVGEAGGRVFIAMEFVEGRSLKALVPSGGLPAETVARYGAQIARALAHAHEHHVVHRDLKAANVVVAAGGQTKLLDFGLSRQSLDEAAGGPRPEAHALSGTGAVVGTPQYIAPEVLLGWGGDARGDIWSLGVVLYEMCSGRVPFGAGGMPGIVAAILQSSPEALPGRVPAGLRAVVLRCLAKDPEQRYQRAGEVAAALEALLPETLLTPAPARSGAQAGRRPARRVLLTLGAVAVVAVLAAAWWHFRGPGPGATPIETSTILILPMEVRGQVRDADFAGRAFAEALAIRLAQARGLHVLPVPATGELWNAGALGRTRAAFLAGAGRLVLGALTREGDSLRASVSLIDTRANQVLWGEERTASGGDLSLLASTLAVPLASHLGARPPREYDYFMYETGPPQMAGSPEMTEAMGAVRRYELPKSLEATRRLVERFPREPDAHVLRGVALLIDLVARGPDSSRTTAITLELETLHRLDRDNPWYDAARAMLMPPGPQSIRLLSQAVERKDLTPAARGALLAMRADKFAGVGDTSAAIADGEQAVRLDPASDLSLSTLARALSRARRYGDAAQRVRQALALNPTVVNYWLQLGNCMLKQRRWQEYVADLGRAAALSPEADAIFSAQSDGLSCLGRYREAAGCARRALQLKPARWYYGLQLGLSLMRLGRWQEAVPLLDRACAAGYPVNCPIHAAARAVALLGAGDAAAAQAQAQRATAMVGVDTSLATVESRSGDYAMACYLTLRGDRDEAIRLLQRFPGKGWVEPALERDPNLIALRSDPRFQRVASWMRTQPIDRIFSEWGRSP